MTSALVRALEHGTVRLGYHTVDFESAVRGLLVPPLLHRGVNPERVEEIVDSVLRREEAGSTCSGPIALPHARITGIPEIVAGLGINVDGVFTNGETRVMLAFVSPAEAAGDHLRFLSSAAKTFRDPNFLGLVQSASTAEDLLEMLRDREPASR